MSLAYRWKQTIGDTSERRTQHNIWQYEATHGIGYHHAIAALAMADAVLKDILYAYRYVTITKHPTALTVAPRSGAIFTVEAIGAPPRCTSAVARAAAWS